MTPCHRHHPHNSLAVLGISHPNLNPTVACYIDFSPSRSQATSVLTSASFKACTIRFHPLGDVGRAPCTLMPDGLLESAFVVSALVLLPPSALAGTMR
jgi:hypothetical protein